MRATALGLLRCPICHSTRLDLGGTVADGGEVREGAVHCAACRARYPVRRGIADLMPAPSPTVVREVKGWVEMLGETNEAMVADMLRLPYLESDVWITTALNFDQAMAEISPAGKRILDVGAGRAWSSRRLAAAGAEAVVAVDVLTERFIGLETADLYFEADATRFERVVGDMHDLPVGSAVFDLVFMTGTLHHSSAPEQVLREVARALAPGGLAIVINEPVKNALRRRILDGNPELAHGINENVYGLGRYLSAARAAGLSPRLLFPRSVSERLRRGEHAHVRQELGPLGYRLVRRLSRSGARDLTGTVLRLAYRVASMPLVMVATRSGTGGGS